MQIEKAAPRDLSAIADIYEAIHDGEEAGRTTIGWVRGVYPTKETAAEALKRGDLFAGKENGSVVAAAIINQRTEEEYQYGAWRFPAPENQVMVLHTLAVSPAQTGKGYGRQFVRFYEMYALAHGCLYLRMDTNERNAKARAMYRRYGYEEVGIVPCVFHGIGNVNLVLLEKYLPKTDG